MREIYKLQWNIIQNQAVVWKIFRFNWFKKEDFLPEDSFLQKFTKEIPDWIGFNFYSIWKKNKWYQIEIQFDNFYFQVRKLLERTYSINEEKLKEFDDYYQKWKENMKGIIDNSLLEENYFASFLPTIKGFDNNVRMSARYQNDRINHITALNNINYKYYFWENIQPVNNIPVFPHTITTNSTFKTKDFDFNQETEQLFDTFLDDLYNHTVNIIVKDRVKHINPNAKNIEKEIYMFFKSLIPKVYQLGEEVFYDQLDYYAFSDSYFYPISWYYLKIFDINFLTKFISNELVTTTETEILKKVLREAVKNDLIDYYVIKSSVIRDRVKLSLEYDKAKRRYIYKQSNKNYIININNTLERKLIDNIWEHFNARWRYWLTVWLYSKQKDNIFIVIKQLIDAYRKQDIKAYFDLFEKENWFQYNNYLSVWLAENLQISNFNWLYTYLINDRVLPVKPNMYWWTDLKTNTPIFLNPFESFKRWNRNIVLVGDSWMWKSILSQQMLMTVLSEKIIAIDPAGTFSNIAKVYPLTKIDVLTEMDNPLYIDTDTQLYKKLWSKFNAEWLYKEKTEMILKILQVKFLETENQLRNYIGNIISWLYKKYDGKITISLLYKELEDIFVKIKNNETDKLDIWKPIFDTISNERWLEKIWELMWSIDNLEGNYIFNILNKEKDFLAQIWSIPKMIFKIDKLNLSKLKSQAQTWKIDADGMIRLLHFEVLVDAISQFYLLNKEYVDNVLELEYDKKIKSYLFIDEVHNLLEIPILRPVLNNFIREIRNRYASAFLITQNITDFPNSMLKNIMVKMFLSTQDVNDYLNKVKWINKEEKESEYEEETNEIKMLKLYAKEYEKAVDSHTWVESLGFYHYWKEVFLTRNILSDYILKWYTKDGKKIFEILQT